MTIIITKNFNEKMIEFNLDDSFVEVVADELDGEYFDPEGKTVITFDYKENHYIVEATKKDEDVRLTHLGLSRVIKAK